MKKERQGQRPKRLQAFVDGDGEEKEGAKQSWPLVRLAPALPVIRARGLGLFRESLRGDGCTNLHPRIQVGLFVAYPEYWLLSTEFRYHQYSSEFDSDAVLTASTPTPTSGSGWNIDSGGVGTLLTPEGAPHLQVRLCHRSMCSIHGDWIARTSTVSSQELRDITLISPPCYITSQVSGVSFR